MQELWVGENSSLLLVPRCVESARFGESKRFYLCVGGFQFFYAKRN